MIGGLLHRTLTLVPRSELNVFYFTFNSERSVRIWGIGGGAVVCYTRLLRSFLPQR